MISTGSGFIVDQDGLIITNAHVIGNQSKVKVNYNYFIYLIENFLQKFKRSTSETIRKT